MTTVSPGSGTTGADARITRTPSEQAWLRVRGELKRRRFELALQAAHDYPPAARVAGTPLTAAPRWIPAAPLPLEAVAIDLVAIDPVAGVPDGVGQAAVTGRGPGGEGVRPVDAAGRRYPGYTAAMAVLDRPAVFADLPTYRLHDADLSLPGGRGALTLGLGSYFDGVDVGEACAHEFVAGPERPLRQAVGEPWDLQRRPVNLAISTLTIRLDRTAGPGRLGGTAGAAGSATMLLHRRDPTKVGHAGGLLQVVPAGIFQPSGPAEWNLRNDFDLWRSITREYSEELLGTAEEYGSDRQPIDYGAWPFAASLAQARRDGGVRVSVLGLGVDPLTFATDLLTVAVFEAPVFDSLFAGLVATNAEGSVFAGIPFTERTVERLLRDEPVQAAGAALVALAWRHRDVLLS
ncbi:transcriptional regulator [Parafrankia sp. FMc2]|uniref:transcriptional regulator n=1 Tax=Parafrankia sp. FMc2 TaxID=3233196 RepID=UPI0034D45BA5